jgi:HAD superfamily hydrolase (TIGR01509 family)
MLKALLFDMDGVLVDSTFAIWTSYSTLLKDENVHFSEEYIKKNLARSLRDNLAAFKKEFHIKDYDLMDFSKKTGAIQLDMLKEEKVDINLIKLLEQAKKHNIKCAVATSSTRWRAENILDIIRIRKFFDVVVTAEDVTSHKPAPDVFLHAAKSINVKPEECVVFEDARNGIEAAKAAGMKSIGKLTKYNSMDELERADLIINDFSELNLEKIRELFE